MKRNSSFNKVLITGSAGFIGFHLSKSLLKEGYHVQGYDGLTDYYDINLKKKRHTLLCEYKNFYMSEGLIDDNKNFYKIAENFQPDIIIHLAAQAGVRHSIEHPRAFLDANIIGTFNVMEAAKKLNVKHIMMASTSSVYGANNKTPFREIDKTESQLSIYASTKKANESMAHSYSYTSDLPTTMMRFFTVYGPWGRPDMALFKFVRSILSDKPIYLFNEGNMYRDFTYIDDIIKSIKLLINKIPNKKEFIEIDTLSDVAPYRIVNIGNSEKVNLLNFVNIIQELLDKKAIIKHMPLQQGDVIETYADTSLLFHLTKFRPKTNIKDGIFEFIEWYKDYYKE